MVGRTRPVVLPPELHQVSLTTKPRGFLDKGIFSVLSFSSFSFSVYSYVICDHMRALHVYISALNSTCPLVGIPCNSYDKFLMGQCPNCDIFKGQCPTIGQKPPHNNLSQSFKHWQTHTHRCLICCVVPGLSKNSGIVLSPVPTEQKVFLLTSSSSPFCG